MSEPSSQQRDDSSSPSAALGPLPDAPMVSVIVPSYNQGRFVRETIDSILSQSYRPLEVLVIDGASADETVDVLKSYASAAELRWWSEPDSGVVEAVNKGFERAKGEVAAVQSSDDLYMPGALAAAVDAFRHDPDLGLVYGDTMTVDEHGAELSKSQIAPFSLEAFLTKQTWIPQPSAFFRLALARGLGGWDDRYFVPDTELWLRMVFRTRVCKIDKLLSKRRLHPGQRDERAREIRDGYWRMVEESPDIKSAPRRLQRAAACGKYMHAVRYNPSGSDWLACAYLWAAVLAYPRILASIGLSSALVPGLVPLRSILSKSKRFILGRWAPHEHVES